MSNDLNLHFKLENIKLVFKKSIQICIQLSREKERVLFLV